MPANVSRGVPLLDIGTISNQIPGQGPAGSYLLCSWISCGEATLQYLPLAKSQAVGVSRRRSGAALEKSAQQSRARIRRYTAHNRLGYMPTLTFRNDPVTLRGVEVAVHDFARKLVRAGIDEPYLWVPERGSLHGRLHVHWLCAWWKRLGAVEVCQRCATDQLRAIRSNIPPVGSLCVGCIWGHGFVGAPSEVVGDPGKAAAYVSKYVSKDLVGVLTEGRHRYHVARGHQPEALRERFSGYGEALARAVALQGAPISVDWLQGVVPDWQGPPTWSLRFPLASA